MKLLTDQDVYVITVCFLRELGHDVATAEEWGKSQSSDADLLRAAQGQDRIFITRDRDFGALVFVKTLGAGVVYLRGPLSHLEAVHDELRRVLMRYDEQELRGAFVVVEPGRHRMRRPAPDGESPNTKSTET